MMDQLKTILSGDDGRKSLMVNCGTALILSDREGFLDSFDSIMLNCGAFFGSSKAYASFMAKGGIVNSVTSAVREINGEIVQIASNTEITNGMDYAGKFVVCVGTAIVRDDGGKAFANAEGIHVTGTLYYPKECETAFLSKVTGISMPYPQDAYLAIGNKKLSELLHIIPEEKSHVWVHGEITAMEESDLAKAKEKGLRFTSTSLFTFESLNDRYGSMFHTEKQTLVPDGYETTADITLRAGEVALYGPRIFTKGDLILHKKDASCLETLESIIVTGTATIPASSAEVFRKIGKAGEYEITSDDTDETVVVNGFQTMGHDYLQALVRKSKAVSIKVNGALLFGEDVIEDDMNAIASIDINGLAIIPDAAQGALAPKINRVNGMFLTIEAMTSMTGLRIEEILAKLYKIGENANTTSINTETYVLV